MVECGCDCGVMDFVSDLIPEDKTTQLPYNRQRAERVMHQMEHYMIKIHVDMDSGAGIQGNGVCVGGRKGVRLEEDPLLKIYSRSDSAFCQFCFSSYSKKFALSCFLQLLCHFAARFISGFP